MDAEGLEYYIMGDMNANLIASNLDNNSRRLTDIADVYGLQQLISEPTRVSSFSSTMIDLIFTNSPTRWFAPVSPTSALVIIVLFMFFANLQLDNLLIMIQL